jgi:hypothetical protein
MTIAMKHVLDEISEMLAQAAAGAELTYSFPTVDEAKGHYLTILDNALLDPSATASHQNLKISYPDGGSLRFEAYSD